METLEFLENETGENPAGCVIWMHGLGADATDFEPIVPLLPLNVSLRFVSPTLLFGPLLLTAAWKCGLVRHKPCVTLASNDDIRESVEAINQLVDIKVARGFPDQMPLPVLPGRRDRIELELGITTIARNHGAFYLRK